jgi:hypothetical protein
VALDDDMLIRIFKYEYIGAILRLLRFRTCVYIFVSWSGSNQNIFGHFKKRKDFVEALMEMCIVFPTVAGCPSLDPKGRELDAATQSFHVHRISHGCRLSIS